MYRWSGLFLLFYALNMVAGVPASLIVVLIPSALQLSSVSGTLWQGEAGELRWGDSLLGTLSWRGRWLNGLPAWQLALSGEETGQGGVTVSWSGDWRLTHGHWRLPAEKLLMISGYRLPLTPGGEITLTLDDWRINSRECKALEARLLWRDAVIDAAGKKLALGRPQAKLWCDPQRLRFTLLPQPPLRLSAEGSIAAEGGWRLAGEIGEPGALPEPWRQPLEMFTRQGERGQRTFEASGRWKNR